MNIQTHIASKIKNLQSEPDTIVVLQGVPLAILPDAFAAELATIDWAALLSHPINYFTQEIVTKQRHVLLIEEYRLLKAYLLTEFPEIMIVRNNLYIDTYPVAAAWPADVRTALLAHFDADAGEETDLRAAENAMGIYGALFEQDGRLYAAYPEEETSSKVFDEPLFDEVARKLPTQKAEKARNLLDETDYLAIVCEVLEKPAGPVALRITDYTGGKERLQQRLVLLASVADVQLVLAEEAAITALDDDVFRQETIETVRKGRKELSLALTEMGCNLFEGSLYADPMTANEFEKKYVRKQEPRAAELS